MHQKLSNKHAPACDCRAGIEYRLREFKNGTLHLYKVCTACGLFASFPCKRESISLAKWRELLQRIGREVVPL